MLDFTLRIIRSGPSALSVRNRSHDNRRLHSDVSIGTALPTQPSLVPSFCVRLSPRTQMADVEGKKLTELRVIDLKTELERRGLDKSGNKAALLERLSKVRRTPFFFLHSILSLSLKSRFTVLRKQHSVRRHISNPIDVIVGFYR